MKLSRTLTMQIFVILFGMMILFPFTNCMKINKDKMLMELSSNADLTNTTTLKTGIQLYSTNCSSCHQSFESSSKLGRTTADLNSSIKTAISNQQSMRFLNFLTDEEIQKISQALSTYQPPAGINNDLGILSTKPFVGNRYHIKNNLTELFVADTSPDSSDTTIATVIDTLVSKKAEAFGGGCTRYDEGCMSTTCGPGGDGACVGTLDLYMNAPANATFNAISKAYLIRACEEILTVDKAVNNILNKSGLTPSTVVNKDNILILMTYIYRDRPVTAAAADELVNLGNNAKNLNYNITGQWRMILTPLCSSSAMDQM